MLSCPAITKVAHWLQNSLFVVIAIVMLTSEGAEAGRFYDDLTSEIQDISANAYVRFNAGNWITKVNGFELRWRVPRDTIGKIKFDYKNKYFRSGSVKFLPHPVNVWAISDDICFSMGIKEIIYDEGGEPVAGDYKIDNYENCSNAGSFYSITHHLVFQDTSSLFHGDALAGFATAQLCDDQWKDCVTRPMVKHIRFFGGETAGGVETDALNIRLEPDARVAMGANTWFQFSDSAMLRASALEYNAEQEFASGKIEELTAPISEGRIREGNTDLLLGASSKFNLKNIIFSSDKGLVSITDGSFNGSLGGGSVLRTNNRDSSISEFRFQSGNLELTKFELTQLENESEFNFSAETAKINGSLSGGRFSSSIDNWFDLSGADLDLELICPSGCRALVLTPEKTSVKGNVKKISVSSSSGSISLGSGDRISLTDLSLALIEAAIDTDMPGFLDGKVSLSGSLSADQDMSLADGITLQGATGSIDPTILTYSFDEAQPFGSVGLSGKGTLVGSINGNSFSSKEGLEFDIPIRRNQGSRYFVDGASFGGSFAVELEGFSSGAVDFIINDLRTDSQTQKGTALVKLSIRDISKTIEIDAQGDTNHKVPFTVGIHDVSTSGIRVNVNNGDFSFSDFELENPSFLLVAYSDSEVFRKDFRVCAPKAKVKKRSYSIAIGNASVLFNQGDISVNISGISFDPKFEIEVEGKDCVVAGAAVCKLLGGGLGGALICGKGLEDGIKDIESKVNNEIEKFLAGASFSF